MSTLTIPKPIRHCLTLNRIVRVISRQLLTKVFEIVYKWFGNKGWGKEGELQVNTNVNFMLVVMLRLRYPFEILKLKGFA